MCKNDEPGNATSKESENNEDSPIDTSSGKNNSDPQNNINQKNLADKANVILDITLKSISVLFTLCVLIGTSVTSLYLEKTGLAQELPSILSSPQLLISIAFYSILFSFIIIFNALFVPIILDLCEEHKYFEWPKQDRKDSFLFHFLIVFTPITVSTWGTFFFEAADNSNTIAISTILVTTTIYCWYLGLTLRGNFFMNVKKFGLVLLAQTVLISFLVLIILALAKPIESMEGNFMQFLFYCIFFGLYCMTVALVCSTKNWMSYVPVVFIALLFVGLSFGSDESRNVLAKLGLGGIEVSYILDKKYESAFMVIEDQGFNLNCSISDSTCSLEKAWLVFSASNKVIIASSKKAKSKITLPTSAILLEYSPKDIPSK